MELEQCIVWTTAGFSFLEMVLYIAEHIKTMVKSHTLSVTVIVQLSFLKCLL